MNHKNLTIGYFLAFAYELYLPVAIWLLFFLKYLNFTEVAFIGALATISANLFEIPTGAISDLIGRKYTLFWSFIFSAVGLGVIAMGNVFGVFIVGRIIQGLGKSLYSGTHESFMYDTLKSSGNSEEYDHVIARSETITWIGLFVASVLGGFVYDMWDKGPFIISAVLYIFAAILCLFLDEPKIDSEIFNFKNYMKQNLQGFSELFKNRKTTIISILMITVASGYYFGVRILGVSQAEQYGLSGTGVGILFGVGYIVAALASHFYPKLKKKLGNAQLLMLATTVLIGSFILAPFVGVAVGSFLIILRISSSTTFGNAQSVIMNGIITSKNRATALSTLSLLSQVPFTLTFYFVGRYIDAHSPNSFALLLGILLVVALVPQLFLVRKYYYD